jgi:hypothetical protein
MLQSALPWGDKAAFFEFPLSASFSLAHPPGILVSTR